MSLRRTTNKRDLALDPFPQFFRLDRIAELIVPQKEILKLKLDGQVQPTGIVIIVWYDIRAF
jgi:hypothetical protein